jgi:hypothetical protein
MGYGLDLFQGILAIIPSFKCMMTQEVACLSIYYLSIDLVWVGSQDYNHIRQSLILVCGLLCTDLLLEFLLSFISFASCTTCT